MAQIGGDFFDVLEPDTGSLGILVADVTGHGIGPALLATRVSSEVRYGIRHLGSPSDIVRNLNAFICENFAETGLFLTFFAARIDLNKREITWSGAGHPSPTRVAP